MKKPVISIIVPVYNVELYLQRCIDSILAQTYRDFELIIVDDGSTDACPQKCDDYAKKDCRIKVVHQQQNTGLPAARKTGFEQSVGEFIAFVDSDDWVEPNYLEILYERIKKDDADVVVCSFFQEFPSSMRYVDFAMPSDKDGILHSFNCCQGYMNFLWNKLLKRSLFENFRELFPVGISVWEDLYVTFRLFWYAQTIRQVHTPLYHYNRANVSAMTYTHSRQSLFDKMYVTNSIENFLCEMGAVQQYKGVLYNCKLNTKLLLVISKPLRDKSLWKSVYPEADAYIRKSMLRFDFKLLLWLCSKGFFRLAYILQDAKRAYVQHFAI